MIKRCILISITIHLIWRRIDRQGGEGREGGQGSLVGDGGSGAGHRMLISHNINVYNRMCNVSNEKHNNVPSNDITYVYIYIYMLYTYIGVYIYIYIQTRHNAQLPIPHSSLVVHFLFLSLRGSLRGGLTQRWGSYAGFMRRVLPGVDPWRYQVAKCACSAGPDLGSLSSRSRVHTRSRA